MRSNDEADAVSAAAFRVVNAFKPMNEPTPVSNELPTHRISFLKRLGEKLTQD